MAGRQPLHGQSEARTRRTASPCTAATSGRAPPYAVAPRKTGGPPASGYAHACSVAMPVPCRRAPDPPPTPPARTAARRPAAIAACRSRPAGRPIRCPSAAGRSARPAARPLVARVPDEHEVVGADKPDARRPREDAGLGVEPRADRQRRQARRSCAGSLVPPGPELQFDAAHFFAADDRRPDAVASNARSGAPRSQPRRPRRGVRSAAAPRRSRSARGLGRDARQQLRDAPAAARPSAPPRRSTP